MALLSLVPEVSKHNGCS